MSLTSHVGAGSSWHVLFGAELINFATSSTVTAAKSASDDVTRRGTSYSGVAVVDARTESTLCRGVAQRHVMERDRATLCRPIDRQALWTRLGKAN